MLLQAMADQFGVQVHRVRRRRVQGRARAEVQLRLRRVPRLRPRELPEGGLLEGGAARRPRAGAAEERLAVRRADPAHGGARHASSCSRAARSTTSPRVKAQVDYIKERVPGRRGLRPPAHAARPARSAPRWRRCASSSASGTSTFIGLDAGDRPRVHVDRTTRRRAATSARTTARARSSTPRRPTARPAATSRASPARRAPSRSKEAMLALVDERKKLHEAVPEPGRLRGEARVHALLRAGADARARRADRGRRGQEDAARRDPPRGRSSARSSARARRRGRSAATSASASRACSTSTRPAPFFRTYFETLGIAEAERRVLRRDHRGDVGRGRQVRLDRSLLPVEGRAGAHPQPALPPPHEKKPLNYIFFPFLTHVPTFVVEHDGHGVAARSSPARPRS